MNNKVINKLDELGQDYWLGDMHFDINIYLDEETEEWKVTIYLIELDPNNKDGDGFYRTVTEGDTLSGTLEGKLSANL